MVYEDPDELGYWTGVRPAIDICNDIMPRHERESILAAATAASEDDHATAEVERRKGGYDGAAIAALGTGRG